MFGSYSVFRTKHALYDLGLKMLARILEKDTLHILIKDAMVCEEPSSLKHTSDF